LGFGGGGGGALPNHEHTLIPLDGGPLDLAGVTVGSMNAGDITFSDGAALQQLVYPAVPNGETLTAVALSTAPSWVAAAGGGASYELVDSVDTIADVDTMTCTFAAIDMADISHLVVIFNGSTNNAGATIKMRINNIATNTYDINTLNIAAGAGVFGGGLANNSFEVKQANSTLFQGVAILTTGNTTGGASEQLIQCQSRVIEGRDSHQVYGVNTTTSQTSFTEIELETASGAANRFVAGCSLAVYRVNNT